MRLQLCALPCICPGQVCSNMRNGSRVCKEYLVAAMTSIRVLARSPATVYTRQVSTRVCKCRWCGCHKVATAKAQRFSSAGKWHFSMACGSLDSRGTLKRYYIMLKISC